MSEVQNFLADVGQDGSNEVTQTPSESLPESNSMEESPSSQGETKSENNIENEEKLPFHKHPRWKAKQEEINSLRQTVENLLPLKEEVERMKQSFNKVSSTETPQIAPWFSAMFGENLDAWKIWEAKEREDKVRLKQEIIQEYESKQQERVQQQNAQQKWIDDELAQLKSEGKDFNNNELLKVIDEFRPIDDKGNWDFKKGYEILSMKKMSQKKQDSNNSRQKLASLSTSEPRSEENTKNYATNLDFLGGKRGF